ncbi:transcriptional regulator with XRE-family HTH domain [Catenibacillus scindens]|uniref:Transcriptional regulator with XRE-family HTH domain n=1 Tax=Catenibacillus scindens TaxID=673271 RepID=A0A7W8HAV6_9FIRM|nr:helix-turn-helix transcriptional regulator [Catenibacillus scindens]MBB5264870.1 transcriptional regulator with XRE-family HTH domain [Catenibacillus scindens]
MENAVNRRILELCKERGYTVYRLSSLSGIPTSTITSILKRNNAPTIPTLQKICQALDLTLAQFFSQGFDTLTPSQSEYLEEFTRLNPHERELVLAYIRGITDARSGNEKSSKTSSRKKSKE